MKLPNKVKIIEVGPRDGFQNLKTYIPAEIKIKEIELLIASGVKSIEVTSFVHPKAIPQMVDAVEVASAIAEKYKDKVNLMALVPNARGAENALKCGINNVAYVISASEAHNKANVNRTVQESLTDLRELIKKLPELEVRLDLATAFGCPFLGNIKEEDVLNLIDSALDAGVKEIVLCDTIGVAHPSQVYKLSQMVLDKYSGVPVTLHLHDTRGMAIANILAGLSAGIISVEGSVGGLGGCPFAPGAAGNAATEDIINMLHSEGIETGIDFDKYRKAVDFVKQNIQKDLTSHMVNACQYSGIK